MSRIGKLPIILPSTVTGKEHENSITITGPYGSLVREIPDKLVITITENQIILSVKSNNRLSRQLFGLMRTLINNMVIGVAQKFNRQLELKGVGYRAQVKEKELTLNLGYSHPVVLPVPEGIEVNVEANTQITVKGIDKEKVGEFAAIIRSKRPPEPYKGKGILYKGEVINRKVGKSGK